MKQTIAELGVGGEGWIIYSEYNLPKRVVHVYVVDNLDRDREYLIPKYVLRVYIESNGVATTKDLVVSGNEIVYSTKEEAEEELRNEVSNTTAHTEQKDVEWKKLIDELGHIQKQFSEITEDQKKDAYTFIKKLKNITNPQLDSINWNQVRVDASINFLNAILETTKHSVTEQSVINNIYVRTAIGYADALIKELKRSEALFEEKLKEI